MTPRKLNIVVDPGHGLIAANGLPGDAGAVGNGTTEAAQNMAVALSLKAALYQAGHAVRLTHTDQHRPSWYTRTWGQGRCDLFLAIHHDIAQGGPMVYFPESTADVQYPNSPLSPLLSRSFAQLLAAEAHSPPLRVIADDAGYSPHPRLYIRDVQARVSVLWEIAAVHTETLPERVACQGALLRAIAAAQAHGVLPVS